MRELIIQAIELRKFIEFDYVNKSEPTKVQRYRRVAVGALGFTRTGALAIRALQFNGSSRSRRSPFWRLFLLSNISNIKIVDGLNYRPTSLKGYRRNDRQMRGIAVQLSKEVEQLKITIYENGSPR